MKTIFILAGVKYDSTRQRPQHMAVYFASKGCRVVYVGLPEEKEVIDEDVFNAISTEELFNLYSKKNDDCVYVLKRVLNSEKKENAGLDELLGRLEIYFTPENTTFIVAFPDWMKYLNKISKTCRLVYDCIDDWEAFVTDLDWGYHQELIHNERKIAGMADLVIASARSLCLKMANFNNNVYYLPNGVWNNDYKKQKCTQPRDLEKINRPIIFFMGAIAGWVDTGLIEYLAENRPEYSFVFIGDEVRQKLPSSSNIHFLGRKKYEELPSYLEQARVAIIPFKVSKLTVAVTPLKFYEYLSSATPVVTTMMPDLLDLKGSRVASDYKQFLKFIDEFVDMEDSQYVELQEGALSTSLEYDWGTLLEHLCYFITQSKKINITTREFAYNTIQLYEKYKDNIVIRNELLHLYNFVGEYDKSVEIILDEAVSSVDGFELDYNQMALAQFKNYNYEAARSLITKYLESKGQHRLLNKYCRSLVNSDNIVVLEILILKLCGRQVEALNRIDALNYNDNPIILGLLAGLYTDIGEYEIAEGCAIEAIKLSNLSINEFLDPYVISALINQCKKNENFDLAEELALNLLNFDSELDEKVYEILGEIYLSKYSRI